MACQDIRANVRCNTSSQRSTESLFLILLLCTFDGNRCDAEPGALADYILALLKHNVPESEMRHELAVQLDEFLEKGSF